MHQYSVKYDLEDIQSYNAEELKRQIHENSKALEESIKELKASSFKISNNVK